MKFEELFLEAGRARNEIGYLVMRAEKYRELQERRLALQRIKSDQSRDQNQKSAALQSQN